MGTPTQKTDAAEPAEAGSGKIHDKDSLFMRHYVGEADDKETGITYELGCQGFGPGAPIVSSSKTGKFFTLSWQDILKLAIAAGIDE